MVLLDLASLQLSPMSSSCQIFSRSRLKFCGEFYFDHMCTFLELHSMLFIDLCTHLISMLIKTCVIIFLYILLLGKYC